MDLKMIRSLAVRWSKPLWRSTRDLLPIIVVIGVFQVFVFQQPPADVGRLLIGVGLLIVGLTLFVSGLEIGLFPLGEQLAYDFAKWGSLYWLIAFAFALGFGTTFAEPALTAVAAKAAGLLADADPERQGITPQRAALLLRMTVGVAVGCALSVGVLRIILGWPTQYLMLSSYVLLAVMTPFAPPAVIGLAYDVGTVTMSTVTVPLTAALGIGLASSIKGRSALIDGFGVIALAAILPSLFVMFLGIVS